MLVSNFKFTKNISHKSMTTLNDEPSTSSLVIHSLNFTSKKSRISIFKNAWSGNNLSEKLKNKNDFFLSFWLDHCPWACWETKNYLRLETLRGSKKNTKKIVKDLTWMNLRNLTSNSNKKNFVIYIFLEWFLLFSWLNKKDK